MEAEKLGCSPNVWLEALSRRLIDASAGRGGIESLLQFLEELDFIPELAPMRESIKRHSIFFFMSVEKCNKEHLEMPVLWRQNQISDLLGLKCCSCDYTSGWMAAPSRCPKCSSALEPVYVSIEVSMLEQGLNMTPEAILMCVAYDRYAECYMQAYNAFKLVMENTAKIFGWGQYRIEQPELRDDMDKYRLGRLIGETHIPREEKQILTFLVRGNLAGISQDDAEKLIRLGVEVLKWGYIFQELGVTGADALYENAAVKYGVLHDEINTRIRVTLAGLYAERRERTIHLTKTLGGYYAPCLLLDKKVWETGQISTDITLEPLQKLPIFPEAEYGPLQIAYGPRGSGKTFLLSSIICYAISSKREMVFCPMNDKSNSFALSSLPLFGYDRRTNQLLETLQNLEVEPAAIPCLTLTILRKNEKVLDIEKDPPTVFDRIIEVEDPAGFEVDFDKVMDELKTVGMSRSSRPVGMVNVRNLQRFDPASNIYIDAQVASNLLIQFDRWRKSHLNFPARVVIDEIHDIASAQVVLYARDALRSAATVGDFIKESRRNLLSLELATQRPLEIQPDIRDAATNVFFRNLPVSKDKNRSQIDFLLDSLQLQDPSEKIVVRDINNRGLFRGTLFWFWYYQRSYDIEVIQPCPPTFCLHDPRKTPREIFKLYEKQTDEKVLLRSWSEVPVLESVKKTEVERNKLG